MFLPPLAYNTIFSNGLAFIIHPSLSPYDLSILTILDLLSSKSLGLIVYLLLLLARFPGKFNISTSKIGRPLLWAPSHPVFSFSSSSWSLSLSKWFLLTFFSIVLSSFLLLGFLERGPVMIEYFVSRRSTESYIGSFLRRNFSLFSLPLFFGRVVLRLFRCFHSAVWSLVTLRYLGWGSSIRQSMLCISWLCVSSGMGFLSGSLEGCPYSFY